MKTSTTRTLALLAALVAAAGCSRAPQWSPTPASAGGDHSVSRPAASSPAVYQAEVDEGVGAGIVILVDTSGSMKNKAPGDSRTKSEVAREALAKMLAATDDFLKKRPDFSIRVGVMHFSSSAWRDYPIQPYDREAVAAALDGLPAPGGGTAIGAAMARARPELYRSGVYRKYMIVVTDGENTAGADPARVAREIYRRSEGAVQFYFVAFDTDPAKFGFVRDVGGEVVGAGNSAELETALKDIYEGKILAEADYGESGLYDPRQKTGEPR